MAPRETECRTGNPLHALHRRTSDDPVSANELGEANDNTLVYRLGRVLLNDLCP